MGRVEHAAEPVLALYLVPVHAGVQHPRIRIAQDQNAHRDVFSGIPFGVMGDRQPAQIDIVAFQHHLLDRRIRRVDRDRFLGLGRAFAEPVQDGALRLSRIDAKRETEQFVAAERTGHQRQFAALDAVHANYGIASVCRQFLLDYACFQYRVDLFRHADEIIRPGLARLAEKASEILIHLLVLRPAVYFALPQRPEPLPRRPKELDCRQQKQGDAV